jgi:hypothetical protein
LVGHATVELHEATDRCPREKVGIGLRVEKHERSQEQSHTGSHDAPPARESGEPRTDAPFTGEGDGVGVRLEAFLHDPRRSAYRGSCFLPSITTRRASASLKSTHGKVIWYGVYAAAVLLYYFTALALGLEPRNQLMGTWRGPLVITAGLGALWVVVTALGVVYERPRSLAEMAVEAKQRLWSTVSIEHIAGIFILVAGVNAMFDAFAAFKPAIPDFHEYSWDPLLADADQALHLGAAPSALLARLPGWESLVGLLDRAYVRWYEVMTLTLLGVLALARSRARLQFFTGYVTLWILGGTVMGTLMASGGPVYYERFTGDAARFAGLFGSLDTAAPLARTLQENLWTAYVTPGGAFPFEGISAMPSLHVAVAAYFAAWAWRWGWLAGGIATLWTMIILVGSVALGWHYAIDGYAGVLIALAIHWASERFVASRPSLPTT